MEVPAHLAQFFAGSMDPEKTGPPPEVVEDALHFIDKITARIHANGDHLSTADAAFVQSILQYALPQIDALLSHGNPLKDDITKMQRTFEHLLQWYASQSEA